MEKSCDLSEQNGADLKEFMGDLVHDESVWKKGNEINISGGPHTFKIKPNPTPNQPGNARIYIKGKAPLWSESAGDALKADSFKECHEEFKNKPLKEINSSTSKYEANVLLAFEVARRIEKPSNAKALTPEEVQEGINKALENGEKDELIKMFIAKGVGKKGNSYADFEARRQAYNNIVNSPQKSSSGIEELSGRIHDMNLSSQQAKRSSQQAKLSSQQVKPSSQQAKSSSQQVKPSSQQAKPSSQQTKPSSQQAKSSSQQAKPSSQQAKPSSQQAKSSSQQAKRSSQQAKPSGRRTSSKKV